MKVGQTVPSPVGQVIHNNLPPTKYRYFHYLFSFYLNLYHVYLSISLGEQNLIYGCYSKEDDTKVEQDRCQLLKDPRGKPYKCERSPCSAEQYVNPASLV